MHKKRFCFRFHSLVLFFLLLFSLIPSGVQSQVKNVPLPEGYKHTESLPALLQEANEAYRNNKLEKALRGYLYISQQGIENGYLAYNLGNTYFRLGQLGPALLWYERALNYLPRDEDVRVNFRYARNQIVDEEFKPPEPTGTAAVFKAMHNFFNLRESLYLTLALFWIWVLCLTAYIWLDSDRWRPRLRIPCLIVGVVFIIFLLSSGIKIYQYEYVTEAIVMRSAVDVKTAPSDEFSTAFTLHEGTKVIVDESKDDWVRITLPGNEAFTGWMPKNSVVRI